LWLGAVQQGVSDYPFLSPGIRPPVVNVIDCTPKV
jgi:hypothetical protein